MTGVMAYVVGACLASAFVGWTVGTLCELRRGRATVEHLSEMLVAERFAREADYYRVLRPVCEALRTAIGFGPVSAETMARTCARAVALSQMEGRFSDDDHEPTTSGA